MPSLQIDRGGVSAAAPDFVEGGRGGERRTDMPCQMQGNGGWKMRPVMPSDGSATKAKTDATARDLRIVEFAPSSAIGSLMHLHGYLENLWEETGPCPCLFMY